MVAELAVEAIATGFLHETTLGSAGADVVGSDLLHAADTGGLHGINPADLYTPDSLDSSHAGSLHIGDLAHAGGSALGTLHIGCACHL